MSIDPKLIMELREKTGAGIVDCRQALMQANNNLDQAVEVLRQKGAIKAAKKSDRATKEGVMALASQADKIAVVGLACETDFVARTQDFIDVVKNFAQRLLTGNQAEFESWARQQIKDELAVKIGENIQLVAAQIFQGKVIGSYLHSNRKIASVVVLSAGSVGLANDLAMQVTAMSPKYIKPEDIPAAVIDKEKEIYREQLKAEKKPQAMWEKIIPGKLAKYYQEVCLLKQPYIKDDKIKVEDLIKPAGEGIQVVEFFRYQI